MTVRILSCDGGGIRGYISSTLIRDLNEETQGKLLNNIDGFAGTSTGGIISTALAAGVSIDVLVNIYATMADEIFVENGWFLAEGEVRFDDPDEQAKHEQMRERGIFSGPGITSCQYKATGLNSIMARYVGGKSLGDIDQSKFLAVNTAQLSNDALKNPRWSPVTFNNKKVGADYSDVLLVDVALATSAAPSYFPPHSVPGFGYFADGGTFANDPVMNALEVALASGMAGTHDDIEVISIGTGLNPEGIPPDAVGDPLKWGVIRWFGFFDPKVPRFAMLDMVLALSAENSGGSSQQILGKRMVRINPLLPSAIALDGHSDADYQAMDRAIASAKKMPCWQEAVTKVNSW